MTDKKFKLFYGNVELGDVVSEWMDFPSVGGTFTPNLNLRRTKKREKLWTMIATSVRDSIFDETLFNDYRGEFDEFIDSDEWYLLDDEGKKFTISIPGFFVEKMGIEWS